MRPVTLLGFIVLSAAAAAARGAPASSFVVTLDDFSRRSIRVDAFDGQTLSGLEVEQNAPAQVPAARLLVLTRGATSPTASEDAFVLSRTDGQRLVGKPGAIRDDTLRFTTASLGEWQVPLTSIVSLDRASGNVPSPSATPLSQDELRLTNGDAVVGIVSEATDERVTCRAADGQAVPVEWANVRQLRFAQAAGEAQPATATATYRLTLLDGSQVGATELRIEAGRVRVRAGDRAIDVSADAVARIESLAGSTRLLSNAPATASSTSPFFPRFGPAHSANRVASVAAAHGATAAIAARPRSKMTWPTAGARSLHARYVIPAGLPRADVSIRVLADDRVVFERQHVRAGEMTPPVDVPLESAKSVTLEADFGDGYDAQDEFYWLDAALVGVAE